MEDRCYVAVDGDDVGRQLEALVVANDEAGLREFALGFSRLLSDIKQGIGDEDSIDIVLWGGDSLLVSMPASRADRFCANVQRLATRRGFSFSGGIGGSMRAAYLGLKIAKASGKRQFRYAHQWEVE
jgi:minimal CRISPR polymerase domain